MTIGNDKLGHALQTLLDTSDYGLCIKNSDDIVTTQNDICVIQCGKKINATCNNCQITNFLHDPLFFPIKSFETVLISGQPCQAVQFNQKNAKTTIFIPLKKFQDTIKSHLATCQLTPSELTISGYIVEQKNNSAILDLCHISKATLKTHINKIYQKAPFLKTYRNANT